MSHPGFAVVDLETTGLFTGRNDRVLEIAVVHVSGDGEITGEWQTLVNPSRDLGPQRIHGIVAADIINAPTFAEIAPALIDLLAGRVLVAHNASFDVGFLAAEFERLGYWFSVTPMCTMQLAREFIPGAGRSLADCCDAYGIVLENAHRASVDARATAELLSAYLASVPMWNGWREPGLIAELTSLAPTSVLWVERRSASERHTSFLERITVKLPDFTGPAEQLDYLALLDRCLLDRQISAHEANELVSLAESKRIGRATCEALHLEYFGQLTTVAWADGVLTDDERSDLEMVGTALSLPAATIEAAMVFRPVELLEAPVATFALTAGDLVVLTGEMLRPRDDWHGELVARGFVPWAGVTKKVKLVVAADPDSLSGKAKKARDYGIPIVGEAGLVALLSSMEGQFA